jgi:hypothetical protein
VKRASDSRLALLVRRLRETLVWSLPVLLPVVLGTVSLLVALPEDSHAGRLIGVSFFGIPAVALVGACARATQSERLGESGSAAWLNAFGGAGIGIGFGYVLWCLAVEANCHGDYECPF